MGKLLRNREVRRYLLGACILGAVCLPVCFWIHKAAGLIAAALFVGILFMFTRLTGSRYRELERLSDQLAKIAAGAYAMDIEAYAEGELSILASEILKITQTLSHQAESMQRDKIFLADSLADISHQLKTPLTSVSMMTELLSEPDLTEEKRAEFLTGIRKGLARIQWLIASLLKLSRLDAGAVLFQTEQVTVQELIEQAVYPLQIPMELKRQTFLLSGAEGLSLSCDKRWLGEAVGNLLKNCVEHAPQGGEIAVVCSHNALYTSFEIMDNGLGIDKKELPRIFERFYRGRNAAEDSAGIGLALAKAIIQEQGGVITAGNRVEGGMCFTVKLYNKIIV